MNSFINCSCSNCNEQVKMLRCIISYRCSKCNKIQCLICSKSHDCACDFFRELTSTEESKKAPTHNRSTRTSRRAQSLYIPKVSTSTISTKRQSMPVNPRKIHCDTCNEDYAEKYFYKHMKTKKHNKASIMMDFNAEGNSNDDADSIYGSLD